MDKSATPQNHDTAAIPSNLKTESYNFPTSDLSTEASKWSWLVSVSFSSTNVCIWVVCAAVFPNLAWSGCVVVAALSALSVSINYDSKDDQFSPPAGKAHSVECAAL